MATQLRKSYRFALRSALFITIILGFWVILLFVLGILPLADWPWSVVGILLTFVVCFLVIQIRAERFIYRRIKQIYDDVTLLESTSLTRGPITTDMKTLTEEIEKFAQDKKIEIDTLKIREEYRKEFLGNVSHELKTPLFTVQG
jgi:two-component system phosphate regulon sensor histidine kinase PhoR